MSKSRRLHSREWKRKWLQGRISLSCRYGASSFGPFGGGWSWCLGIKGGGTTWVFSLLLAEVVFSLRKGEPVRFYLHKNLSFIKNYFGEIGPKVYVPWWKWAWFKAWGYRGGIEGIGQSEATSKEAA